MLSEVEHRLAFRNNLQSGFKQFLSARNINSARNVNVEIHYKPAVTWYSSVSMATTSATTLLFQATEQHKIKHINTHMAPTNVYNENKIYSLVTCGLLRAMILASVSLIAPQNLTYSVLVARGGQQVNLAG